MVARVKSEDLSSTDDLHTLHPRSQSFPPGKQRLYSINYRLARYFDRVRFLETENRRLTKKVEIAQDWSDIKSMYECELANVRKSLDETAFEKSKLQINIARLVEENEYYNQMIQKQCSELDAAHAKEHFYRNIQNEYDSVCSKYEKALDNSHEMQRRLHQLNRQLNELSKALEIETMAHIDSENAALKLRRELAFHNQLQAETPRIFDHPKWESNESSPEQHMHHHQASWMEYDRNHWDHHQSNDFRQKTEELRAENEKLKFIIADSEAQLRAEKGRNGELESEIVHLRQKVAQLHQKCNNSTINVQVSFDDKNVATDDKVQQKLHVTKSMCAANVSSESSVVHRSKTEMIGQRANRRVSIESTCKRTKHKHIGRKPTAATNKWAVGSRIAQSFQRLKTVSKLLEFDKIKESRAFYELKKMKQIYFQK